MRRSLMILSGLLAAVLVAGPAGATEFTDVVFAGGCTDWTSELGVHFRSGVTEAQVGYDVAILAADGTVMLQTTGEDTVYDEDGDRHGTLLLGTSWDAITDETIELYGLFTVRGVFTLYVPWLDEVYTWVEEREVTLECAVVPNDQLSWGALKSEYR